MSPPAMNGGIASSSCAPRPERARTPSARASCARRTRRSRRRAPGRRPGRAGTAWAPSMSTSAPASCAASTISRTGLIVPERVRDVGERDELRLEAEQDLEDVLAQDAVVGDRDELEVAVLLLGEDLPRDEVRVVLHLGEHDRVAAADVVAAPRVRDEVDRLGRVAGEDDLVAVGGVDEPGHRGARRLVGRRRALADLVDPAVDVRGVLVVVAVERVDDRLRLLARRRGVEEDERLAVGLGLEDREVAPDDLRIELAVLDPAAELGRARGQLDRRRRS